MREMTEQYRIALLCHLSRKQDTRDFEKRVAKENEIKILELARDKILNDQSLLTFSNKNYCIHVISEKIKRLK